MTSTRWNTPPEPGTHRVDTPSPIDIDDGVWVDQPRRDPLRGWAKTPPEWFHAPADAMQVAVVLDSIQQNRSHVTITLARLADAMGVSPDAARARLRKAEQCGLVTVTVRRKAGPNTYRVHNPARTPPGVDAQVGVASTPGGSGVDTSPGGGVDTSPGGGVDARHIKTTPPESNIITVAAWAQSPADADGLNPRQPQYGVIPTELAGMGGEAVQASPVPGFLDDLNEHLLTGVGFALRPTNEVRRACSFLHGKAPMDVAADVRKWLEVTNPTRSRAGFTATVILPALAAGEMPPAPPRVAPATPTPPHIRDLLPDSSNTATADEIHQHTARIRALLHESTSKERVS